MSIKLSPAMAIVDNYVHHQTTTKDLMEIHVDDHFKTTIMVDDLVNQGEAETKQQQLTVTETSFSQVFPFS